MTLAMTLAMTLKSCTVSCTSTIHEKAKLLPHCFVSTLSLSTTDKDAQIQRAVHAALATTAAMDRIIMDDYTVVPKPVKIAVFHVLMREKIRSYILLIGLYW
jgi:hypothetical protein